MTSNSQASPSDKAAISESLYSSAQSQISTFNDINALYSSNNNSSLDSNGYQPDVVKHGSFLSSSSTVKVEIADIDNDELVNPTTFALKRCKRLVLAPYSRLLVFIGWRSLGKDSITSGSCGWKFINFIYTFLIVCLLLFSYAYQALLCHGKLNIHSDTQIITRLEPTPTSNGSVTMAYIFNRTSPKFDPYKLNQMPYNSGLMTIIPANLTVEQPNAQCYHIVSTYIIPSFFHLLAFVLGFIHFRLKDNEHLYFIMEKVFLQADPYHARGVTQNRIIRNARMIIWTGAFWVMLTVILQVLFLLAFGWDSDMQRNILDFESNTIIFITLTTLELMGSIIYSCVFMAVTVNYVLQCELLIFNIQTICTHLREKSLDIKSSMQNILSVRESISRLNGPLARMTGLCIMTLAELTVIGACLLILNKIVSWKVWLYRVAFPFVWFLNMFIPLFQAARLTKHGEKLRQISFEMRVFGHKKNSQLDLDSFILFVSNASLRAKLFSVPMKPALLMSLTGLLVFTLIILFQTGVIAGDKIFF